MDSNQPGDDAPLGSEKLTGWEFNPPDAEKPGNPRRVYQSEVGETLLSRAIDLISGQLTQFRELNAAARHLLEETSNERRNMLVAREELDYQLRYLEKKQTGELNAGFIPLPRPTVKLKLSAEELENRRQRLLDNQERLAQRDNQLELVQHDVDDAARRLSLLVRQLEIAGSQLTRAQDKAGTFSQEMENNPWELVLRAQLLQGQEEERGRLAREVHDGPAQVLANAVMQLEQAVLKMQKGRNDPRRELEGLVGLLRESLFEMRRFMFNLQPRTLFQHGLNHTLQEFCADFGNQYALDITLDVGDFSGWFSPEQEMAVFRIVQEALQNVRKHSEGRRVQIYSTYDRDGLISLMIRDDGKGFRAGTAELNMNRGAGIGGMKERAELSGGKLFVKSSPGNGTEIVLRLKPAGPRVSG
jgi:two-component system sensor histidine kinase DegS